MVDVSYQMVLSTLQTVSIMVGIYYYLMILRNTEKTRRKDIMFQRINIIDEDFYDKLAKMSQEDWSTFHEWTEYRKEHPESYNFIAYIMMTLNSIGVLLMQNIVDEETLFKAFSPPLVVWTWEKTSPIVMAWRETINLPDYHGGFEYLYNRALKLYPDMRRRLDFGQALTQYLAEHSNKP
jgi:hypothetical protein